MRTARAAPRPDERTCQDRYDHDRARDDAKVAKEYARIEREQADKATDPKVKAMVKAGHGDEPGRDAVDDARNAYGAGAVQDDRAGGQERGSLF